MKLRLMSSLPQPPEAVWPCRAGGLAWLAGSQAGACVLGAVALWLLACRCGPRRALRSGRSKTGMEPEVAAHRHRAGGADPPGALRNRSAGIALPAAALVTLITALQHRFRLLAGPLRMWARQLTHGGLWSGDHPAVSASSAPPTPMPFAAGRAGDALGDGLAACWERRSPPGAGGFWGSANRC